MGLTIVIGDDSIDFFMFHFMLCLFYDRLRLYIRDNSTSNAIIFLFAHSYVEFHGDKYAASIIISPKKELYK